MWDEEWENERKNEREGEGKRKGEGIGEENDFVKGMGKDGEGGGLVKGMVKEKRKVKGMGMGKVKDCRCLRKYSHQGPQEHGEAELSERHNGI